MELLFISQILILSSLLGFAHNSLGEYQLLRMDFVNWKSIFWKLLVLIFLLLVPVCFGTTDPRDVVAINSLYSSLGSPVLPGWVPNGGDPCAENWQGVQCVNANITGIILKDLNLGGELGDRLGDFTSLILIDMSNNHIGGVIPSNLPSTVQTFSLSSNQFTGTVPGTLSSLGQVTSLAFDNNHLTGEIPDAFQPLSILANLNLSGNSLSGPLPHSMGSLSSLTTLHLQNNQLTGTLDVLQDLPLRDLDIENNLFSGPIPPKLLTIPNFRKDGNPFNTSILPSPPALSPSQIYFPAPDLAPTHQASGPSSPSLPGHQSTQGKQHTSRNYTWIIISSALLLILVAFGVCFLIYKCSKRMQPSRKISRSYGTGFYDDPIGKTKSNTSLPKLYSPKETGYKEPGLRPLITNAKSHQRTSSSFNSMAKDKDFDTTSSIAKSNTDHEIDMSSVLDEDFLPPPPPPFYHPPEKVNLNPLISPLSTISISTKIPSSVRSFTIASLQQYTDSFSQENLIGRGLVGSVFRAKTSSGRMLAVKKLNTSACKNSDDFLELVCNVSKLQHPNILELVGYCAEHGQHLLVYEYCGNGSLYEALHFDDEIRMSLSWNNRIRLALGAARALEYMHEVSQPPVVHRNFKLANILLDDELVVHVSDCGLAPLLLSNSLSQLSSSGYGAPELELGTYTTKSDVYSFGVVMLEILSGRKSYDRSRPRGEQFLVRWASHQLHDIDSLARMVDPSLSGTYTTKSLSRFADIISLCLQPEPEFRPPMSEIVENLLHMI